MRPTYGGVGRHKTKYRKMLLTFIGTLRYAYAQSRTFLQQ